MSCVQSEGQSSGLPGQCSGEGEGCLLRLLQLGLPCTAGSVYQVSVVAGTLARVALYREPSCGSTITVLENVFSFPLLETRKRFSGR